MLSPLGLVSLSRKPGHRQNCLGSSSRLLVPRSTLVIAGFLSENEKQTKLTDSCHVVGTCHLAAFQQTFSFRLFAHSHTRITGLEVKGKRQVQASCADENGKQTKLLHVCNIYTLISSSSFPKRLISALAPLQMRLVNRYGYHPRQDFSDSY